MLLLYYKNRDGREINQMLGSVMLFIKFYRWCIYGQLLHNVISLPSLEFQGMVPLTNKIITEHSS